MPDDRVALYVRVPPEVHERLRQIAEANDRSVNAEVARLCRLHVDDPRHELEPRRRAA